VPSTSPGGSAERRWALQIPLDVADEQIGQVSLDDLERIHEKQQRGVEAPVLRRRLLHAFVGQDRRECLMTTLEKRRGEVGGSIPQAADRMGVRRPLSSASHSRSPATTTPMLDADTLRVSSQCPLSSSCQYATALKKRVRRKSVSSDLTSSVITRLRARRAHSHRK
jgi:hypothetical protein